MLTGLEGLLILGGAVAGFVNTVAGGGSALTLPLLMLTGLDASQANATNRIGVVFQSLSGAATFHRKGLRPWREVGIALPASLAGSALGTLAATWVPAATLERLFGVVFLLLAVTMVARPRWLAPTPRPDGRGRPPGVGGHLAFFAVGFYGGMFQAGVGIPLLLVAVGIFGVDLVRGTAIKVGLVLAYTLVSLGIFIWLTDLAWRSGLILAVGSALGSAVGARLAIKGGATFIRVMVALALLVAAARTLGITALFR